MYSCARASIDLINLAEVGLAIEVGPQSHARNTCRGFDSKHALGGNFVPVRHGWLRNSNAPREFGNPANSLDRLVQARITHVERCSEVSPHPLEKRSKG